MQENSLILLCPQSPSAFCQALPNRTERVYVPFHFPWVLICFEDTASSIYSFFFFLIYLFVLIGGWLLYSIVVVFAIHWHESAMGVHVFSILNPLPPPSPSHPSGSSQYTSPECLVSYIEPGLAIHFTYGNIHVSMLFSQIIPFSPSLTESKSLFFISVSLLLSYIQGYCYHLSKFHIYALVYCIGVFHLDLLHSV